MTDDSTPSRSAREAPEPEMQYCDRCDGVGNYEGGPFLLTRCEACNGTGIVPVDPPSIPLATRAAQGGR